jgi:hypothetical protein
MVGAGMLLFSVSLVNGFLIESLLIPRLGLSAHLVALIGSSFLVALGAYWTRLGLTRRVSRLGVLLSIVGFWGGWTVYFTAAAIGAGGNFPMAGGGISGAPAAESAVRLGLLVVLLALGSLIAVVMRGLRPRRA